MNDNEGVAEMLIESMGTTIVNTTDSKGRWEIKIDLNFSRLYCWGVHKLCCYIVNCLHRCRTPLHAAAFSDHVECVSILLGHGAQANIVDTHSHRTPLMMAALNGQTNTVGQYTH